MLTNISFSALNLWLLCGECCRRTYFETPIPPGIAMWRGRSFHSAAEINHKQKIDSYIDLKLDYLKDYCRDSYVHGINDEGFYLPLDEKPYKNKLLNKGLSEAVTAVEVYKKDIAPTLQPKTVEKYIRTDIGLEMPISGRIDVEDSNDTIVDFKVGKRKQKNWEHTDFQPTFYGLLKYMTEKKLPKFLFNIIPSNGIVQKLPTTRSFDDFTILIRYVKLFIKDIKAGIFRPASPGHWKCQPKWCGYYYTCKYCQSSLNF